MEDTKLYRSIIRLTSLNFERTYDLREAYRIMLSHVRYLLNNCYLYNIYVKLWICMINTEKFIIDAADLKSWSSKRIITGRGYKDKQLFDENITCIDNSFCIDKIGHNGCSINDSNDDVQDSGQHIIDVQPHDVIKTILLDVFTRNHDCLENVIFKTSALDGMLASKKIMAREIMEVIINGLNCVAINNIVNRMDYDAELRNIEIDYLVSRMKTVQNYMLTTHKQIDTEFSDCLFEGSFVAIKNAEYIDEKIVSICQKALTIGILSGKIAITRIKALFTTECILKKDELLSQMAINVIKILFVKAILRNESSLPQHRLVKTETMVFIPAMSLNDVVDTLPFDVDSYASTEKLLDLYDFFIFFFTDGCLVDLKENTKYYICKNIHVFAGYKIIEEIISTLKNSNGVNEKLADVLLLLSFCNKPKKISEYNNYFKQHIQHCIKNGYFNALKRTIDYYSTFICNNNVDFVSYDFLKSNIEWYKKFMVLYFQKVRMNQKPSSHVENFLLFFLSSKDSSLLSVFNSLPYIDRSFSCLSDIFTYVHELMCEDDCFNSRSKSSFEVLMMPFLLKMPALFVKNNHALIYHAEKLKLKNYNYTGIIEYLSDKTTLESNPIAVFRKIHQEVTLKGEFKEKYVKTLIVFAQKNTYETTDKIVAEILNLLLRKNLYDDTYRVRFAYPISDAVESHERLQFKCGQHSFLAQQFNDGMDAPAGFSTMGCINDNFFYISDEDARHVSNTVSIDLFSLLYSTEFYKNLQILLTRDPGYGMLYEKILFTLRVNTPYFYNYIVFNMNASISCNFCFNICLKYTLLRNEQIINFIFSFPSNIVKNVEQMTKESTIFVTGSLCALRDDDICNYEKVRNDYRQLICAFSHSLFETSAQGINDPWFDDVGEFSNNLGNKHNNVLEKYNHFSPSPLQKYDFFIDLIFVNQKNAAIIRSAINFLLRMIEYEYNLYLLYVILKIYKILKIHEPIIDELLAKAITHVDFRIDIYADLAELTVDFYQFYFYSLSNCVEEDTKKCVINLNLLPSDKKDFVHNTFYLKRRYSGIHPGQMVYKNYILSEDEILDVLTIIRTCEDIDTSKYLTKLNNIDIFYIPQLIQLLRSDKYFEVIKEKILKLIKVDNQHGILVFLNLRANFAENKKNNQLFQKIRESCGFMETIRFLDNFAAISEKMMKFKSLPKSEKERELNNLINEVKIEASVFLPVFGYKVCGVIKNSARVLQSHAKIPFLVTFDVEKDGESKQIDLIFKTGDDCRQDQLALQLIQLFLNIFKESNLPIFLYPYKIISTNYGSGIIEVIPDSISRDQMGRQKISSLSDYFGLKFGFRESVEYKLTKRRFLLSFVGYSLVTYFLNVKDRHNGNIMINGKGQMIHIDFGFMLEISPGNLNFEAPLKITKEILELLDHNMDEFESLMIKGFFALRRRSKEIVLMAASFEHSNLPCFSKYAIDNLIERFKFCMSDDELKIYVRSLIHTNIRKFRTYIYDKFQSITNDITF